MSLEPTGNVPVTFSDLPYEEGLKHFEDMADHSTASFKEKLTYAGYNDVEVHYIVTEEDKVVPAEYQTGMIELIKTSSGREPSVHQIKSGHTPNVSQPGPLADIVKGIVERVREVGLQ